MADGPARYAVVYHRRAIEELYDIAARIRRDIGEDTALRYLDRMEHQLAGLDLFPQIGRQVRPPAAQVPEVRRTSSFDGRYTIVFVIVEDPRQVRIAHIHGGGHNIPLDRVDDEDAAFDSL